MKNLSEQGFRDRSLEEYGETSHRLDIVDVMNLSLEEEVALEKRVLDASGHINILVHPYYDDYPGGIFSTSEEYLEERDLFIRESILSSGNDPLVIFEESHQLRELKIRLSDLQGDLYVVSTQRSDPTPKTPNKNGKAWAHLGHIFRELGVTEVGVGGRYLFVGQLRDMIPINRSQAVEELARLREIGKNKPHASKWVREDVRLSGCVGGAAKMILLEGFDVHLSSITSPMVLIPD